MIFSPISMTKFLMSSHRVCQNVFTKVNHFCMTSFTFSIQSVIYGLTKSMTSCVFSLIPPKSVAHARAKAPNTAITAIRGADISHSHAITGGSTSQIAPTATASQAIAQDISSIFLAISGFCADQSISFCSSGLSLLTIFVNISSNHHSTIFQFENHHKDASATHILSLRVDITQLNVLLFASIRPKNCHHSDVAIFIASATSSKDIHHLSISCCNSDIDFHVLSAITFSGLKPALII